MHSINTIIGKIVSYPSVKKTIISNSRIVSFFNSSHYWGGQLEKICKENGVTRGLKTNTESRFYALILQALSVREHKTSLMTLCVRDDAQQSQTHPTLENSTMLIKFHLGLRYAGDGRRRWRQNWLLISRLTFTHRRRFRVGRVMGETGGNPSW